MTAQLRAEFRKMRTTRTNFGLLLGLVVLVLLGVMGGSFGSEWTSRRRRISAR